MQFDVLFSLIEYIILSRENLNKKWSEESGHEPINYRKRKVCDINKDSKIWDNIIKYRSFLNDHQMEILASISNFQNQNNVINTRIKQLNSIQYKYHKYLTGDLKGKSAINKCFNDLYGLRIIINYSFSFDEIKSAVECRFPDLKVINANKDAYYATHIYFQENNYVFPWELQVWEKCKEKDNLISHNEYKQDYVKWESDLKNKEV